MSPVKSGVTGPNFTNFLHDMRASYALLMRTARPWYCNYFPAKVKGAPNAGGISWRWYIFATLFGCHGNVPWQIGKKLQIHHLDAILPHFWQNRLRWQRPLRYRNKRSRSIIYNQTAFIRCKDCENRSERAKLMQAKCIALLANLLISN